MKPMKLTIELVPKSSFFKNVRSEVSKADWDVLRKKVYKDAGYKCEICGGVGKEWPVECHEIWKYEEIDGVNTQRLVRMIALCPMCHKCKHIGLAQIRGELEMCVKHLMKVNNVDRHFVVVYLRKVFNLWKLRSEHKYKLDLNVLKEANNG